VNFEDYKKSLEDAVKGYGFEFSKNVNEFVKEFKSKDDGYKALRNPFERELKILRSFVIEKYKNSDLSQGDARDENILLEDEYFADKSNKISPEFNKFINNLSKDFEYQELADIARPKFANLRSKILDYKNNRNVFTKAGANNTIYALNIDINKNLDFKNVSIKEILKSVQMLLVQRIASNKKLDGVGAIGGLAEYYKGNLNKFDGERDDLLSKYDNLKIDENGDLRIINNRYEVAKNAARREMKEEIGEDLDAELYECLSETMSSAENVDVAIGLNELPVIDQILFLTRKDIDFFRDAFIADPVCFLTKISQDSFNEFKNLYFEDIKKIEQNGKKKEIKNLLFDSLFDNLKKFGVKKDGRLINTDSEYLNGKVYKYAHEYAVNLKLLGEIAFEIFSEDLEMRKNFIVEVMGIVQREICDELKDNYYKTDLKKCAEIMFPLSKNPEQDIERTCGFPEGTIEEISLLIDKIARPSSSFSIYNHESNRNRY
jgi:hypothetical protein